MEGATVRKVGLEGKGEKSNGSSVGVREGRERGRNGETKRERERLSEDQSDCLMVI